MLLDSFGRRINYLRISVTDRCNLRCIYCMPEEGIPLIPQSEILTYEELIDIAKVCIDLGITKIRVTGGEPLVRKGIVDFIRRLSSLTGLCDLSITTNGTLLKDFAKPLFFAGLKRINVSLDSLDRKKYEMITRVGKLSSVLSGLYEAKKVGFSPIKINVVVIKGLNDTEIFDFVNLAIDFGFFIRFIELMPFAIKKPLFLSNHIIKKKIEERFPLIPEKNDGVARIYSIDGKDAKIGFISPLSGHICKSCNRVRLTPDGKVKNCLFSEKEYDIKKLIRKGERDLSCVIRRIISEKPKSRPKYTDILQMVQLRMMNSLGG